MTLFNNQNNQQTTWTSKLIHQQISKTVSNFIVFFMNINISQRQLEDKSRERFSPTSSLYQSQHFTLARARCAPVFKVHDATNERTHACKHPCVRFSRRALRVPTGNTRASARVVWGAFSSDESGKLIRYRDVITNYYETDWNCFLVLIMMFVVDVLRLLYLFTFTLLLT